LQPINNDAEAFRCPGAKSFLAMEQSQAMQHSSRLIRSLRLFLLIVLNLLPTATNVIAQGKPRIEVVPIVQHSSIVRSVVFSPDDARVLSGSADRTVKLWDAATGRLIRNFIGHSGEIRSVAISPDGARILSGSDDKLLKLWDAATGRLILGFEGHSGAVNSVAFSPDGEQRHEAEALGCGHGPAHSKL
jgi:WD40 repeat protein